MGVTLRSKNLNEDMGYGGFNRFRGKVAELANPIFGEHYQKVDESFRLIPSQREHFFEDYNKKTIQLIEDGVMTAEVANFCYQADCEGSIDKRQAKQIFEIIKDYDDDIAYGYAGRADCATFASLKAIFNDCVENGGKIKWS